MNTQSALIERYIYAVGKRLPSKNRADIQAELRSLLQDSLESKAGENPSEEDVLNLLKEFGPPEKVAASYWPEGQYLIGPRLFPLFRLVLGIALIAFVFVQLVLWGVTAAFNPQELNLLGFLGGLWNSLIMTFGMVVLVFAILQYFDVRPDTEQESESWDPRGLPETDEPDEIKRGELVAGIVFGLIFIALLVLYANGRISEIFGLDVQLLLNPVLTAYLPLIILSFALNLVLDIYLLWRGRWTTATRLVKIGLNLFSIYILALLLTGHNAWLSERGISGFFGSLQTMPQELAANPEEATQVLVMQAFRLAFLIALIVTVVETIGQVYRLVRRLVGKPATSALPA